MKLSNYNVFVHYEPDNIYIGYNCVSGGMYVFNEKQFKVVREKLNTPNKVIADEEKVIKEKLIKGRFLIDDDINELKMLKIRNNIARYNPNGLAIVIAPTLSCNFDCPYCYVDREKVSMNQQTITKIKKFFKKRIQKTNYAAVCWTGGEPLLALDVVENLNSYFASEAKKKNAEFTCSMVTNGYLLTPSVIKRLKNCCIETLQITLDGYREYHDRLRYTLNGEKTYSKILDNLVNASKNGFKIALRSNIEKDNYEGIYNLIDELAESEIDKNRLLFAPCMVMDVKTSKGNYCGNCFNKKEFAEIEPKVLLYSIKKGFKVSKQILSTHSTFCGANTLSLFVIDSYANVLKCWCNLGRAEDNKVGYVKEDGEICFTNHKVLYQWLDWDPFEIEECVKCKVLPICMGGCMYYNIIGETNGIEIGCSHRRHNLEEILKVYYFSATKGASQLKDISMLNSSKLTI